MLKIKYTNKMKRDVKRVTKRGKDIRKLIALLTLLAEQRKLPEQYHDHPLKGEMRGYRECHIEPDWLLVYQVVQEELILLASGTGSHTDLFNE